MDVYLGLGGGSGRGGHFGEGGLLYEHKYILVKRLESWAGQTVTRH